MSTFMVCSTLIVIQMLEIEGTENIMLISAWLYSFVDHFVGLKESSSPAMRGYSLYCLWDIFIVWTSIL